MLLVFDSLLLFVCCLCPTVGVICGDIFDVSLLC